MTQADRFRKRLKGVGLSDSAIAAAWPEWWNDDAESSSSARLELRFSIARKLGLDAQSVLDDEGVPRFVWRDEARFKHLSAESDVERAAISSFGRSVGGLIASASDTGDFSIHGRSGSNLRNAVLQSQSFVRLLDVLALSWSAGIPVIHLRVFPAPRKRMAAMAVGLAGRRCILLAKDSMYPPHIAFYLAHELGHIALGHIKEDAAIVDMESTELSTGSSDKEETEADRFALELLTGSPDLQVYSSSSSYNAPGLAEAVLRASEERRIEPGTLALCFAYSTNQWPIANSAMKFIYADPKPVWREVNRAAIRQLHFDRIPLDTESYLRAVLGEGIE